MKNSGITHLIIGILFIIVIVSVGVNYKLYNECIGKIDTSAKQSKLIGDKVNNVEVTLDGLKLNLESLRVNVDSFKTDMQSFSDKSLQSEGLKNEFSVKMEEIRKELQDLQANYTMAVNDLNAKFNAFKAERDAAKKAEDKLAEEKKVQEKNTEEIKVDLGEISVPTPN
ncbi:MAG: hypothetical protein WCY05_05865 [Candidatus Omnitrophota bacterium]